MSLNFSRQVRLVTFEVKWTLQIIIKMKNMIMAASWTINMDRSLAAIAASISTTNVTSVFDERIRLRTIVYEHVLI